MVLVALMTLLVAKTIQYNVIVIRNISEIRAALYKAQENAELAYGDALARVYAKTASYGEDPLGALATLDPNPSNRSFPAVEEEYQRIYEREGDGYDHGWERDDVYFFGVNVIRYQTRVSGNNIKDAANLTDDDEVEGFDIYIGITNKIVPGYAMTVDRPEYDGVKIRYTANSGGKEVPSPVVYFMDSTKSLYGVPHNLTGPSAVKTIYQWYHTFHGDHTVATEGELYTGPSGAQDGALSDTTTADFGLVPGMGMTLDNSTASNLDTTVEDTLIEHVLGRFLYVTAAPGSAEGYMGDTVASGMTYFSALPVLTGGCKYECVIDPSLVKLTLSETEARAVYKTVTVKGQPLIKNSAIDTSSFVSPGAENFTCGDQLIDINGECTVNSTEIAGGGKSYVSRFMHVDTGSTVTLSGGSSSAMARDKTYHAFVVSRLNGSFPASAEDEENGIMSAPIIAAQAGVTLSGPHTVNAPNNWSITMYTLSSSSAANIVFTPANYSAYGASLDIAEIVLVSGDVTSENDDYKILQYLATKYGVDTVNADNTANIKPIKYI